MAWFKRKTRKAPTRVEWTESTLEAPLYPLEGYENERAEILSAHNARIKHVWCDLRTRPTASGKYAGEPTIEASVNGEVVGVLRASHRERFSDIFAAVVDQGVNVATVCVCVDCGPQGGIAADLTLGPHKYQPHRPW